MSERLIPEEVEELRKWRKEEVISLEYSTQLRVVDYMLRLHDTIQRLQTLQPEDVTPKELNVVDDELPELVFFGRRHIAAVCRGMLREVKGE